MIKKKIFILSTLKFISSKIELSDCFSKPLKGNLERECLVLVEHKLSLHEVVVLSVGVVDIKE